MRVDSNGQDEYFSSVTVDWLKEANWVESVGVHPYGSSQLGADLLTLLLPFSVVIKSSRSTGTELKQKIPTKIPEIFRIPGT